MSASKRIVPKVKCLLDENVDVRVAKVLQSYGWTVSLASKGRTDMQIAGIARDTGSILITLDKDFANPSLFVPSRYSGIIVLRVHPPRLEPITKALNELLLQIPSQKLSGKLFIVGASGVEVIAE